jgi:hypothetical protein
MGWSGNGGQMPDWLIEVRSEHQGASRKSEDETNNCAASQNAPVQSSDLMSAAIPSGLSRGLHEVHVTRQQMPSYGWNAPPVGPWKL